MARRCCISLTGKCEKLCEQDMKATIQGQQLAVIDDFIINLQLVGKFAGTLSADSLRVTKYSAHINSHTKVRGLVC